MSEIPLENAPRKARDHFDKGFVAFEHGNFDYAMDMFQLALELCPQLTRARKFLRAAQIKNFKAHNRAGGMANTLSSLTGMGAAMQAATLIKKNPPKAVAKTEELLRKNPLNPQFVKLSVEAALAAGMPEAAVVTLEAYNENAPGNVEMLRELGKLFQDLGKMREARELYERIYNIRPEDPRSIKDLKDATALDSMQKGNWEGGGSFQEKLKDRDESAALERQSKAVKSEKDTDSLIEETKAKILREPGNANYQRALAKLYLDVQRFDEAIAVLEKALQATGGGDPQIDRALSDARLRQIEHQIARLREAGQEDKAAAVEQQKQDFLLADTEDRVRRYPSDLQFKFEYGVLLFERGAVNEAIGQFQLAQRNPQRRIRSLYYLARCFKEKGQNDIAAEQLAKAKSELMLMDDNKKDIVYELGSVFEAMGQIDKAVEQYKEIYSVDIGFRDVSAKIEKYYKQ